jgi:hypothetical protein
MRSLLGCSIRLPDYWTVIGRELVQGESLAGLLCVQGNATLGEPETAITLENSNVEADPP